MAGWSGRAYSSLPRAVTFQYNAAGLFTRRSNQWWDHHVELQLRDDQRVELAERSVFPMGAFGYRTRLDRILNESSRRPVADTILDHLAVHIAKEIATGNARLRGDSGEEGDSVHDVASDQVVAIRIVRSVWKVGEPELTNPAGAWQPAPVHDLPRSRRRVLGIWRLIGDKAVRVETEPESTASTPAEPSESGVSRRQIVLPGSTTTGSPKADPATKKEPE